MSSDDLFEDLSGNLDINPSPASLTSTPLECSGVTGEGHQGTAAQGSSVSSGGNCCPVCSKILKTKSGFTRHMTAHKLNGNFFVTVKKR